MNSIKYEYIDIPDDVIKILEKLDIDTYNHSIRVCELAKCIETELNYTDNTLSEAALLHDIGKFYISTNILNKPDNLNLVEREIIDLHSYLSYYILITHDIPIDICYIVLFHHFNNPPVLNKLDLENINPSIYKKATILKTIDIYDALTSDRPYKRGFSKKTAIKIMKDMKDIDLITLNIIEKNNSFNRK